MGMKSFKTLSDEETDRINHLQAEYFTRVKHFFDPPYPEGVPERLEQIVAAASIRETDMVMDIGTGTGVLIPLIRQYAPEAIYANDLSESMLASVKERYPEVKILLGGVRKLSLPDASVDVFFINACYPNLVDKHTTFTNLRRMIRPGGRIIISHPMGKAFTRFLKQKMPFPIDDFPQSKAQAEDVFSFYGFRLAGFTDEPLLYILVIQAG